MCVNIETGRVSCGASVDNVTSANWILSNKRMQIGQSVCITLAHALCKEYVIYTTKPWRLCKRDGGHQLGFLDCKVNERSPKVRVENVQTE
jgi:hypothetical protein